MLSTVDIHYLAEIRRSTQQSPSDVTIVCHLFCFDTSTITLTLLRCSGMSSLAPKWVRMGPDGTNPGLFQIRFQHINRGKIPGFVPFGFQSDPL